jgi:diguanylate cyclase (GGDEF)-like protein
MCSSAMAASYVTPAEELDLPLTPEQIRWLNQRDTIRIGAMNDWPPINFVNFKGEPDGFGVALVSLLNQRLGGRLQLISGNWPVLYQNVVDKKLDALLDLTPKKSREAFFLFTKPYLNIPHVIVGRNQPPFFQADADLKGKRLALEKGFGNVTYYQEHYPSIKIQEYANTSEALDAVIRGEADAYIGNRAVVNYIIHNEFISSLKIHSRAEKPGSILAIGVRKDWAELADILQMALNSITTQEFYALLDDVIENQTALPDTYAVKLTAYEKRWLEYHPVISIASDPNWPPLEYTNADQRYQGISTEFIRLAEEKLNIKFERVPVTSRMDLISKIKRRDLDVMSLAVNTPVRNQFMTVSEPYILNGMVIVTRDSVEYVPGVEGLLGKKVAVGKEYASEKILTDQHPELLLDSYDTVKQGLTAVLRGESYAFIGNIAVISHVIQEEGISGLRFSGEVPYQYRLGFGIRSDWPELVGILNKVLDSVSGHERAEMFSRWTYIESKQALPWGWIWSIAGVMVGFIAVTLYWNYTLNQKVKNRTHQLEHRSLHDALTELPNRISLDLQLEQSMALADREGTTFAVMFIDLDDFKAVNDTLGHSTGDKLLLAVARRFKESLRRADFICRFGGDEFVIVTQAIKSKGDIRAMCSHLIETMQAPYMLEDLELAITISIGVACYPADGGSGEDLLRNADAAMYIAKGNGRNQFSFFSE